MQFILDAVLPGAGSFLGSVIRSAAIGAASSAASQAVGVATGIQDKFSFKGVALAALSAGVGASLSDATGIGKLINKTGVFRHAIRGAAGSAISQGIGVATGLQDKFSWSGVAGAAVGADIGANFGGFASTAASAISNAATRSIIDGTNFGDNIIAAIPDVIGQALGGAIANNFSSGDGGGISFNLGGFVDDTFGLVTGLPSGIVDGLSDMRDYVTASLSVRDAKATTGAALRQAETIAKGYYDTQNKIDEVIVTAERNAWYASNRFFSLQFSAHRSLQHKQDNITILDNYQRGLDFVTAQETARGAREHRRYLANHDGFIAEDFNTNQWLALKALDTSYLAVPSTWLNGITTPAGELYGNGKSVPIISLDGELPAHLMSEDWTQAVASGGTMLTGAIGATGVGGMRKGFDVGSVGLTRGRRTGGILGKRNVSYASGVPKLNWKLDVKSKIHGTGQHTGTPGHAARSNRAAIELARDPDVVAVHIDHGYNRALGLAPKTMSRNRRPDVIAIYKDGRVRRIEVQSRTDNIDFLQSRNNRLNPEISAHGFTPLPTEVIHFNPVTGRHIPN